jgi:hypothetical protein
MLNHFSASGFCEARFQKPPKTPQKPRRALLRAQNSVRITFGIGSAAKQFRFNWRGASLQLDPRTLAGRRARFFRGSAVREA